jgi:hypothetical protein
MRHRRFVAAALVCALSIPVTAEAKAGPAGSRDLAVRLDVDVSALPDDRFTKVLRANVVAHQTTTLARAGVSVREGVSEVLRIEIERYGEDDIHYRAMLVIVGDTREGAKREITCEACTDAQLLAKVDAETAVLAGLLRVEPVEPVPEPETETEPPVAVVPEVEAEPEPSDPATPEPVEREEKPVGGAGHAGIASLTLGLGLGIGGVIVAVEDPKLRPRPADDLSYEEASRPALGYGLGAASASLLIAGVVLVAVDQTVLRRRRARRAAAMVVPAFSSTRVGLAITRRF